MKDKDKGAKGFEEDYWEKNYSEPEEMDGIHNAKEHANYLKYFFAVDYVDISSVIDFGFGLGHLFEEILKVFVPYKAEGIEPSKYAFLETKKRNIAPVKSTKVKLQNLDLASWAQLESKQNKIKAFDLGICTSVFQYLNDEEIKLVLPIMARKVKYLYFSAPTEKELQRQASDLEFKDEYAKHRSTKEYMDLVSPHFTIISARILESKYHFDESSTFFTDLLFRF